MDQQIKEWLTGFTCGPCRIEVGSQRRAGVLVLTQEPGRDPEVVPFCYRHASIYFKRSKEPAQPASILGALAEFELAAGCLGRTVVTKVLRRFRG
jgi:hypothetical protein